MNELKYPQDNHNWAQQRGITRKCPHGWRDPNIACPDCKKEEERREKEKKEREEKKRRLKETFENVIWPDKS